MRRMQSVLAVKTQPPAAPPGIIDRPALADLLSTGTTKPITLVSAGPGAGKTLTVAAWTRSGKCSAPIGWLSLDPSDNDVWSFWTTSSSRWSPAAGYPRRAPCGTSLRRTSSAPPRCWNFVAGSPSCRGR